MGVVEKAKRKARSKAVSLLYKSNNHKFIYPSYWHSLFFASKNHNKTEIYFSARPNPGAGIGHQMANWIAGYWFAKEFSLKFAHIPFVNAKWEEFLNFGDGEKTVTELKNQGYKLRYLPLFDETNAEQVELIKKIIASYSGKRVVFIAEQDQFYKDQYGVMDDIKRKYFNSPKRQEKERIYSKDNFNIALHIRRGDVSKEDAEKNPNLKLRYQDNSYYVNALNTVLGEIKTDKNIEIYVFSQSGKEEFPELSSFENLHFCNDLSAMDSFEHMVYADALITSKSSFSYKPALLSSGIKFCPQNFWHAYPKDESFIMLDDVGKILK